MAESGPGVGLQRLREGRGWLFWFLGGCWSVIVLMVVAVIVGLVWWTGLCDRSRVAVTGTWEAVIEKDGVTRTETWRIEEGGRYAHTLSGVSDEGGSTTVSTESGSWELSTCERAGGRLIGVSLTLKPDNPTPTSITWQHFCLLGPDKLGDMEGGKIVTEYKRKH